MAERNVVEHHLISYSNDRSQTRDSLKVLVELTAEDVRVVITKLLDVSIESLEFTMSREEFEHLQQFLFHLNPTSVEIVNGDMM